MYMDDFEYMKNRSEYIKYTETLKNVKEKISGMPEEKIKKILQFAQGQNDLSKLNNEDKLTIAVICENEAQKQVSAIPEEDLRAKREEIWNKHVKYCIGETKEPLTRFESILLQTLDKRLRETQKDKSENVKE